MYRLTELSSINSEDPRGPNKAILLHDDCEDSFGDETIFTT